MVLSGPESLPAIRCLLCCVVSIVPPLDWDRRFVRVWSVSGQDLYGHVTRGRFVFEDRSENVGVDGNVRIGNRSGELVYVGP